MTQLIGSSRIMLPYSSTSTFAMPPISLVPWMGEQLSMNVRNDRHSSPEK